MNSISIQGIDEQLSTLSALFIYTNRPLLADGSVERSSTLDSEQKSCVHPGIVAVLGLPQHDAIKMHSLFTSLYYRSFLGANRQTGLITEE